MITNLKKTIEYLFNFSEKKWHNSILIYSLYLSYLLFFIAFTGIISLPTTYLHILDLAIKYYIILILFIRFNPFVSHTTMTEFDRSLVFTAAIYMLLSTAIFTHVNNYIRFRY